MKELVFTCLSSRVKGSWGADAERFILDNHKEMYIEDIAVAVNRTRGATVNKAFRMGCSIKSKPKGTI